MPEQESVYIEACADDFVVAGAGLEPFPDLAGAAEADRRVVDELGGRIAPVGAAKPNAEPRRFRPVAAACARNVLFGIEQGGVVRCHAAVDDTDDDVLAAQLEIRTQPARLILQAEEDGAVVGLHVLVCVLPDPLDLVALRKPRGLRGGEACRKPVQRVPIAVHLAAGRADAAEQPIVTLLEPLDVTLCRGGVQIEPPAAARSVRGKRGHPAAVACGARGLELDDVDGRRTFVAAHAACEIERLGNRRQPHLGLKRR